MATSFEQRERDPIASRWYMVDARLAIPPAYRFADHLADTGTRRGRVLAVWTVTLSPWQAGRQPRRGSVGTTFAISPNSPGVPDAQRPPSSSFPW
jgi:hypothetical protein